MFGGAEAVADDVTNWKRKKYGWQLIKFAPKEGDHLLVARRVRTDKFDKEIWLMHVAFFNGDKKVWQTIFTESIVEPTHWMYLPEHPVT